MIRAWVAAHRRALQVLLGLLVLVWFGLLFGLPKRFTLSSRVATLVVALPILSIGGLHVLLMYESWFRTKRSVPIEMAKRIMFILLIGGCGIVAVLLLVSLIARW